MLKALPAAEGLDANHFALEPRCDRSLFRLDRIKDRGHLYASKIIIVSPGCMHRSDEDTGLRC